METKLNEVMESVAEVVSENSNENIKDFGLGVGAGVVGLILVKEVILPLGKKAVSKIKNAFNKGKEEVTEVIEEVAEEIEEAVEE